MNLYRHYALRRQWLDVPNQRSSHVIQTPRGGGIVFVCLWAVWLLGAYYNTLLSGYLCTTIGIPSLMIAIVGFMDDIQDIPAKRRLLLQFLAASLVLAGLSRLISVTYLGLPPILAVPLAILALVWSTNLANFMDGIDGITAVEALFVLGTGGWLLYASEATGLAYMAWALSALVAGFLQWNWPPASIFMGDVGSTFLGFFIAALALIGTVHYELSVFYWIMIYGVFWFDATITLMRRLVRGQSVTQPHKLHAYQRLHQSGFSHKQVVWCVIVLNIFLCSVAIWTFYHPARIWVAVLSCLAVLSLAYIGVERRKPIEG